MDVLHESQGHFTVAQSNCPYYYYNKKLENVVEKVFKRNIKISALFITQQNSCALTHVNDLISNSKHAKNNQITSADSDSLHQP